MNISTLSTAMLVMTLATTSTAAQDPMPSPVPVSAAQRSFEAGQYDQALQHVNEIRARGEAGTTEAFIGAHVQLRRSQTDLAKAEFSRLVESGDDTWRRVGESSLAYVDQDNDRALAVANEAVAQINDRTAQAGGQIPQDPGARWRDFAAFYQLGLVKVRFEDWAGAAEAFDRATQINPSFAYAHYYAGLAHSRMKRPDLVASRFEVFLKLAPSAPERGAVMSIMRTLRGN
jgi:tetratricopeptide (TPR) repeat protein